MNYMELIKQRHTVREYLDKAISKEHVVEIEQYLKQINQEAKTNFQLVLKAPQVFTDYLKPKENFENAQNYIALVAGPLDDLALKIGYYGQKVVLFLQNLGLNTCWIASTYVDDPSTYQMKDEEFLVLIISVGYGQHQGKQHLNKPIEETYQAPHDVPSWFLDGVKSALLAPTARNQQSYKFIYHQEGVELVDLGGRWSDLDLGIVKLHFELGAKEPVIWL